MRETVGGALELLGGNGILLEHNVRRFVADAEAILSYEDTWEMEHLDRRALIDRAQRICRKPRSHSHRASKSKSGNRRYTAFNDPAVSVSAV